MSVIGKFQLNLTPVINIRFLVNPRDLGRHALLKVSFMHGLGVITTWVMQLFVMSMMISNVSHNNHDHHEYLMDGGIHAQGND